MEINSWSTYYSNFSRLKTIRNNFVHSYYLFKILKEKPKSVLEVGCGTGSQSSLLSYFIKDVYAIDNNVKVIKMAKNLNKGRNGRVKYIYADAFNLPFENNRFDLCFSQGFFEHFSNKEILSLCKEQLRVANMLFFSVPSDNYFGKDFGNERLLSPKEWYEILHKFSNDYKIDIRYYLFDLGIGSKIRMLKKTKSPVQIIKKPLHIIGKIVKK